MGNQGHTRPGEFRKPLHEVLPDRRLRTTRYIAITNGADVRDALILAWGTADTGPNSGVHALWAGLRLIRQGVAELDGSNYFVRVYETIPATAEVQVGANTRITLEDGREAIEAEFLQFSAGTYVPGTVGTTTAPGDASAYFQKAEQSNDGTLRRIKRTYVYAGTLSTDLQTKQGGKLLIQTIVSVKTVPSTPSGYTLIGQPIQNPSGLPIYSYTYAKGAGLVSVLIGTRQDGLREVTNIALGTRSAPAGVVIRDDYHEADGYAIYTVTAMQTAAGSSTVTNATYSIQAYVPFTYPGRAKAFTETYDSKTFLSTFLSPPVATEVKATITVSYQTTNTLGTISDYWNPSDWATIKKQWTGSYGRISSRHEALPGYRTTSATPVTLAAGANNAIDNSLIYTGTTARITVTGGPSNPDGNTYTLHAAIDERPAFYDVDGTPYYRKTLVSATIPAQAALPV